MVYNMVCVMTTHLKVLELDERRRRGDAVRGRSARPREPAAGAHAPAAHDLLKLHRGLGDGERRAERETPRDDATPRALDARRRRVTRGAVAARRLVAAVGALALVEGVIVVVVGRGGLARDVAPVLGLDARAVGSGGVDEPRRERVRARGEHADRRAFVRLARGLGGGTAARLLGRALAHLGDGALHALQLALEAAAPLLRLGGSHGRYS